MNEKDEKISSWIDRTVKVMSGNPVTVMVRNISNEEIKAGQLVDCSQVKLLTPIEIVWDQVEP